jgi:D-alanine transfer protein
VKRAPHLFAGLAAVLVSLVTAVGFTFYSQSAELNYVNALVPLNLDQTLHGLAIQRAGLQKPDLLPMLGSSEVTLLDNEYQADKFFKTYPTGFTVLQIANLGASSITMAQDLAALGADLKGKKVVISFSPATFTMSQLSPDYYAGNYSRLHVYETLFSPYLDSNLKAVIAKRMMDFPDTYKNDPFLNFVLLQLTSESRISRALYYLSWPLGEIQSQVMQLQDHEIVISYIHANKIDPNVPHETQVIDWDSTLAKALAEQKLNTNTNSFGIENDKWRTYEGMLTHPMPPGSDDKRFINHVLTHGEWADLDILLQVLHQLGAQPLILSRPMNVHVWEAKGVSEQAQNTYYEKLTSTVAPYHFTLVDYQQYGADIYFSIDKGAHTSREGWIYVDQTLDDFFHGRLH